MNNIIFYKKKNGENEVEEYLLELQRKKDKTSKVKFNKIIAYFNMLAKYGKNIGEPYIKHLEDEI